MPTTNRSKARGKKDKGQFIGIPHAVYKSQNYLQLRGWDVKLLVDITAQYHGFNNGDLSASWTLMREKKWRSQGTLNASLKKLLAFGFIEQTRQGGRNRCSLFAITWQPIDDCKGKIEVQPTKFPSKKWQLL
ncbi:MAG: hypothetical protein V4629_02455 [Pseudomonadota bacterium]